MARPVNIVSYSYPIDGPYLTPSPYRVILGPVSGKEACVRGKAGNPTVKIEEEIISW